MQWLRSTRHAAGVAVVVLVAALYANVLDPTAVVNEIGVLAVVGALIVLAVILPALISELADCDGGRS